MKLGSYDDVWNTECNGITFVIISQVLMEWGEFLFNVWQTLIESIYPCSPTHLVTLCIRSWHQVDTKSLHSISHHHDITIWSHWHRWHFLRGIHHPCDVSVWHHRYQLHHRYRLHHDITAWHHSSPMMWLTLMTFLVGSLSSGDTQKAKKISTKYV